MRLAWIALGIAALAGGCKGPGEGLPPATEWQASVGPDVTRNAPMRPQAGGALPRMGAANPHRDMTADGEADEAGDSDEPRPSPHPGFSKGLPNGHPPIAESGVDVTKLGFSAPDPDRQVDPTHRVRGTIRIAAGTKARAKAGTGLFVIVKRAGPDGAPVGPPLAVDILTWSGTSLPFEVSDLNAMVAGTELTGDVIVMARYDQDRDALTKQPGDITGQIRVTVPADKVELSLDTVLP